MAAAAAPGLTLRVEGPESVTDVENFKISTVLTNTGNETLRILNDPLGPLSKLPTETFSIVNSEGSAARFGGVKAKYVPSTAAALGDYTSLAPGESVTVNHELSDAYNLTGSGVGTYNVMPRNLFYLVNEANQISTFRAHLSGAHKTYITGRLAKVTPSPSLFKRARYISCSASQQRALAEAANSAQASASEAKSYFDNDVATQRYTTWFGAADRARQSTVASHFTAINGNNFTDFTYDCTCRVRDIYAYVRPGDFGRIYLCGAFWNTANTGADSRAGTLIHEASHFTANGGTGDFAYGQEDAMGLASENPDQAVMNADSHEYFTENAPFLD